MREVKRNAEVGEKIKVVKEYKDWQIPYPLNSVWTVGKKRSHTSINPNDFSKGIVQGENNDSLIFAEDYVVLEEY